MQKFSYRNWLTPSVSVSIIVFALLVFFTYGLLFKIPYSGFSFSTLNGVVTQIYVMKSAPTLNVGDIVVSIGSVEWSDYIRDRNLYFFENTRPGEVVDIKVMRNGVLLTIPWIYPGFSYLEFMDRFSNIWWLAFVFWFIGTSAQLFMRPVYLQWKLFVVANYLVSLFIIFGSASASHLWGSSILLHVVTWLILPILIQFHWIFPSPLGQIPKSVWYVIYIVSFVAATGELFQLAPRNLYALVFLAALVSSIVLLSFHFVSQENARKDVFLLSLAAFLAMLPSIINSFLASVGPSSFFAAPVTTLSLPVLPGMYFYILNRNQLAGLDSRASRFISIYVFLILLGMVLLFIVRYTSSLQIPNQTMLFVALFVTLFTTLMTILIFPGFQAFVEQRLLGNIAVTYQYSQENHSIRQTSMAEVTRKLRVFLCHSSADKPAVREICHRLRLEGWIDPWLDEEKLLPGHDWDIEIQKAVEDTEAVIVCLSNSSINKEGYIQKEIRKVLDVSDQKPDGTIFLIPVRLEGCDVPKRLHKWHWVNYFENNAYEKIRESLRQRLEDIQSKT